MVFTLQSRLVEYKIYNHNYLEVVCKIFEILIGWSNLAIGPQMIGQIFFLIFDVLNRANWTYFTS